MDNALAKMECVPCRGGVPPLRGEALGKLFGQLDSGWTVIEEHRLEREYRFPDFKEGFDFVVAVGEMAEAQGHHPDIYLAWGKVKLTLWTHKIGGLTESDFIFAAKADRLLNEKQRDIS